MNEATKAMHVRRFARRHPAETLAGAFAVGYAFSGALTARGAAHLLRAGLRYAVLVGLQQVLERITPFSAGRQVMVN